jgi:hypothetical protein
MMNYCFHHSESSVLLCPYGSGINYINHNRSQANIRVQWSEHGKTSHDETWLQKTPNEMLSELSTHLAIDYVAIKDIGQGEELFLDYGHLWEEAWDQYGIRWKPEQLWADGYLNGHDWNIKMANTPLRTEEENIYDPYPTTLQIRCHTSLVESKHWQKTATWTDWKINEYGHPCIIRERIPNQNGDFVYKVQINTEPIDRWDDDFRPLTVVREHVPRAAIHFFNVPYSSDLHLRKAFRQPIGLPNELLPEAWRNRVASSMAGEGVQSSKRGANRKPNARQPGLPPGTDEGAEL